MGLVTLGIFTHTIQGLVSAIFMLAHGFVSSALFIIVTLLYERHLVERHLVKYYCEVAITIIMLLMMLANMAVPLSCNFVGEFLSLLAAFEYSLIGGVGFFRNRFRSRIFSLFV